MEFTLVFNNRNISIPWHIRNDISVKSFFETSYSFFFLSIAKDLYSSITANHPLMVFFLFINNHNLVICREQKYRVASMYQQRRNPIHRKFCAISRPRGKTNGTHQRKWPRLGHRHRHRHRCCRRRRRRRRAGGGADGDSNIGDKRSHTLVRKNTQPSIVDFIYSVQLTAIVLLDYINTLSFWSNFVQSWSVRMSHESTNKGRVIVKLR